MGDTMRISRAALHFWEEPCISGKNGSGTIFFCGCNLKCVFCQNAQISQNPLSGAEVTKERLCQIFLELQSKGAHNINLVTPTHYIRQIGDALSSIKDKLLIPVVYNCGGYELPEALSMLQGLVDIYLTDMKYMDNYLAKAYSNAPDYFQVSKDALDYMIASTGAPVFDNDGMLKSGVIVRHLVLPTHRKDSIALIEFLKREYGTERFILSLMSQYTPYKALEDYPQLNRRVTSFEYNSVVDRAYSLGFTNAYIQERTSAKAEYTPPFDLTGVIK